MSATADKVTIPRSEYEALLAMRERLADLEDRLAGARAIEGYRNDPSSFMPAAMVDRLLAGESPLRLWREQRGLKAQELAEQAGITGAYLSELEAGKKPGSIDVFRKLARVLRVTLDDLAPA